MERCERCLNLSTSFPDPQELDLFLKFIIPLSQIIKKRTHRKASRASLKPHNFFRQCCNPFGSMHNIVSQIDFVIRFSNLQKTQSMACQFQQISFQLLRCLGSFLNLLTFFDESKLFFLSRHDIRFEIFMQLLEICGFCFCDTGLCLKSSNLVSKRLHYTNIHGIHFLRGFSNGFLQTRNFAV